MNSEVLIVKNMKQFIQSIDNLVVNYPRKELVIKNRLFEDSLDILELIYLANYHKDISERRKVQMQILSKISMLDFYLERSYLNKYISEKVFQNKVNQLNRIVKMIYGWIKNNES